MEILKKIVNILVMLYLVLALLIYLDILNIGQHSNPGFFPNFFMAGGILLLLELAVENLYILFIKRGFGQQQNKINELKATLYDHKQELHATKTKHQEELSALRAAQVTHPIANDYAKPVMVPPPTRGYEQPITPNSGPAKDSSFTVTPAPIPPAAPDPEKYPPKNSEYNSYRESNL